MINIYWYQASQTATAEKNVAAISSKAGVTVSPVSFSSALSTEAELPAVTLTTTGGKALYVNGAGTVVENESATDKYGTVHLWINKDALETLIGNQDSEGTYTIKLKSQAAANETKYIRIALAADANGVASSTADLTVGTIVVTSAGVVTVKNASNTTLTALDSGTHSGCYELSAIFSVSPVQDQAQNTANVSSFDSGESDYGSLVWDIR